MSQSENSSPQGFPNESVITLGVLKAVEDERTLTQRSLSLRLGIALGLTNSYLKRCVKKGLIKVKHIPSNRYSYYLTPKGFAEKARLTAEYLSESVRFFREAREEYGELIERCSARGWTRIAFVGSGELAEIACICAADLDTSILGIVDPAAAGSSHADNAIVHSLDDLGDVDAVIITDLRAPQETYDAYLQLLERDRVLVPVLLNISIPPDGAPNARGRK